MKKEIKKEWIKRLRSGDIEQTTGTLGLSNGSRCCLGVLCDIAAEQGVIGPPAKSGVDDVFSHGRDPIAHGVLPPEVCEWADIRNEGSLERSAAEYCKCPDLDSLTTANDRLLMTFPEIADLIENSTLRPYEG